MHLHMEGLMRLELVALTERVYARGSCGHACSVFRAQSRKLV